MAKKNAPAPALDLTTAPVISKALSDKLKGADIGAIVIKATSGLFDSMVVKPSMVKIGKDLERSGMGAGATLESRINVLCSVVVRFAHGVELDDLCAEHRPETVWLYRRAVLDSGAKFGAGITALEMRRGVTGALVALAGAPVRAPNNAPAPVLITAPAPAPAPAPETAPAPAPETGAEYVERMRQNSRGKLRAQGERMNAQMRALIRAERDNAERTEMVRNMTAEGRRANLARDIAGLTPDAVAETLAGTSDAGAILIALAERLGMKVSAPRKRVNG